LKLALKTGHHVPKIPELEGDSDIERDTE
jgi:hypothetical protein